jgi:hypothetical protein
MICKNLVADERYESVPMSNYKAKGLRAISAIVINFAAMGNEGNS